MTVFLVVSTLWPNGHHLRPYTMPRDNIFTAMVAHLWQTDTPTNLWPSIHVYNSIGAHVALCRCSLGKRRWLRGASLILCISIILSTVFLKQHSMFDVLTGLIMASAMYVLVYRQDVLANLKGRCAAEAIPDPRRKSDDTIKEPVEIPTGSLLSLR